MYYLRVGFYSEQGRTRTKHDKSRYIALISIFAHNWRRQNMSTNANLEARYGPAATYSEHTKGDFILYATENEIQIGNIIYVCSLNTGRGPLASTIYIVEPIFYEGTRDIVAPANVIQERRTYHHHPHYDERH
jgi:hypothetical protein